MFKYWNALIKYLSCKHCLIKTKGVYCRCDTCTHFATYEGCPNCMSRTIALLRSEKRTVVTHIGHFEESKN